MSMGAEFAGDDERGVWSSMAAAGDPGAVGGRRKLPLLLLLPRPWRWPSGLRKFEPRDDEKTTERGERGGGGEVKSRTGDGQRLSRAASCALSGWPSW